MARARLINFNPAPKPVVYETRLCHCSLCQIEWEQPWEDRDDNFCIDCNTVQNFLMKSNAELTPEVKASFEVLVSRGVYDAIQ